MTAPSGLPWGRRDDGTLTASAQRKNRGQRADGTLRPSKIRNNARRPERAGHTHEKVNRLTRPFTGVRGDREGYASLQVGEVNTGKLENSKFTVTRTQTCLWALTMFAVEGSDHVAWGLGYEVSHWLRDLPREHLAALMDREARRPHPDSFWATPVRWGDFALDYLPNHFFEVKNLETGRKIRVSEVRRFWGLRELEDVCRDEEITWDGTLAGEVPALEELMVQFRNRTVEAGVVPSRWEGPGQGASALLKRWKSAEFLSGATAKEDGKKNRSGPGNDFDNTDPGPNAAPPREVLEAAGYAYVAHRFELPLPGQHARCRQYDLRGAYPWAICQLPCLAHGTWTHWGRPLMGGIARFRDSQSLQEPITLRLVTWSVGTGHPFGPFPWRYPDGVASYPRSGTAWIWGPEFEAAVALWPPESFEVLDAWTFVPGCAHRPWESLQELLPLRARFPFLKQFTNSIEGKLAQTRPVRGPWFDPISAGIVTSIVRARMLRMAALAGNSAVAIIADALWTRRPVRELEDAVEASRGEPGELKGSTHDDVLMVSGSGLIFEGDQVAAAAGTPARALDGLRGAFQRAWDLKGLEASVGVPFRHLVLPDEALATGLELGTYVDQTREIRFSQGRKRDEFDARYQSVGSPHIMHAVTRPPAAPDPDLIALAGSPRMPVVGGRPMSFPYWDADGKPLCPEPSEWPADEDKVGQ